MEVLLANPYQVFQKAAGCNWFVRFSIPGEGQIRKSTGTRDEAEAHRTAAKLYHEALYRHENGMRAVRRSFSVVAEEFIEHMHRLSKSGEKRSDRGQRTESIVRRYFVAYFGDKAIDAITDTDCARYVEWRRDYWITGPGKDVSHIKYVRKGKTLKRPCTDLKKGSSLSTQRSEAVVLRELFRQAAKWGYINKNIVPEVKLAKAPPSPRPSFTLDEMHKLLKLSRKRADDRLVNAEVRKDRRILHNYVSIAAQTGMRPTELRNLTWGDVLGFVEGLGKKLGERDIRIRCRGKAKHRVFVPLAGALAAFDDLWIMHGKTKPQPSDFVFAHKKLNKSLTSLLTAAGMQTDHRGKKRDSYSFRHFYISQQIRAGVDVFLLARNCGTSPDMIDKHYGQVEVEQFAVALRPEWKQVA